MPLEPSNEEQMADRHAVASGEEEKQHEEQNERLPHWSSQYIVVLNRCMCLWDTLARLKESRWATQPSQPQPPEVFSYTFRPA